MIKVTAVGGYGEVGRNMTLITVDDESVVFDMGMHMDHLLTHVDGQVLNKYSAEDMIEKEVVADDTNVDKDKVVAIVPSHAHLDHIAALPFLANRYDCPIFASPFTCEVIKRQFADNNFEMDNELIKVKSNTKVQVSDNLAVEFIHVTHSTPQTCILVLHTPYGQVVYANDFKFDDEPVLGKPPNYERLKQLDNVQILINECLYAHRQGRTRFEKVAKQSLQKICMDNANKGIFITTFTSHIARIDSIVNTAKALGRKVLCFGRSLEKYMSAAKLSGVSTSIDDVDMYMYKSQIKRKLKKMRPEEKKNCIIICTGHQAEEQAVLNSFTNGVLPNPFSSDDLLIFSCNTIPTESIKKARAELEHKLEKQHLRVFTDVHVSGHASREDLKMLADLTKPKVIIPSHGTDEMMNNYEDFSKDWFDGKVVKLHSGESFDLE